MSIDERIEHLAEELYNILMSDDDNIVPITRFLAKVELTFDGSWITKPVMLILGIMSEIMKREMNKK